MAARRVENEDGEIPRQIAGNLRSMVAAVGARRSKLRAARGLQQRVEDAAALCEGHAPGQVEQDEPAEGHEHEGAAPPPEEHEQAAQQQQSERHPVQRRHPAVDDVPQRGAHGGGCKVLRRRRAGGRKVFELLAGDVWGAVVWGGG